MPFKYRRNENFKLPLCCWSISDKNYIPTSRIEWWKLENMHTGTRKILLSSQEFSNVMDNVKTEFHHLFKIENITQKITYSEAFYASWVKGWTTEIAGGKCKSGHYRMRNWGFVIKSTLFVQSNPWIYFLHYFVSADYVIKHPTWSRLV